MKFLDFDRLLVLGRRQKPLGVSDAIKADDALVDVILRPELFVERDYFFLQFLGVGDGLRFRPLLLVERRLELCVLLFFLPQGRSELL